METAYRHQDYTVPQLKHNYGPRVHILAQPSLLTRLARACSPECDSLELVRHVRSLYREMASIVANVEFPRRQVRSKTRMAESHRQARYEGEVIDPGTKVVCVAIARAGLVPSQVACEMFMTLVDRRSVRQDYVFANRKTDEKGRVVGTDLSGSKIGGKIGGSILILPDPMAATGGSISSAIDHYKSLRIGKPKKVIALHLITTPEYIRRLRNDHPDAIIYAIRLDRSLSPRHVLLEKPGKYWKEERGLNDRQYIVPGGGGFGELMNNAEE